MKANLNTNAEKFKSFWSNLNLYQQLSTRNSSLVFTLHDGPPYANGNIHLGHALNKVLKDFIIRYQALKGACIHYIPGWDTHGLPIENKVEKEENYRDKSSLSKRASCRVYALEQVEIQRKQFEKLHLLSDFKTIYKTLDPSFISFELEAFYSLLEQNLLYWDLKPVAWSWSSQTALAESEIIYSEEEARSIYFWFPLSREHKLKGYTLKKNTRLLIWTTTPYTLEANLALALNPSFNYAVVRTPENKEYIVLEDLASTLGTVIHTFTGEELKGAEYLNPLTKEKKRVLTADFVVSGTGTGIVHIAPGYGLEDYYACLKENIEIYVSINKEGHFIPNTKFPPINNLFYIKAIGIIIDWLKQEGYLHKEEKIKHNVGHDWRTEKPLIYLASPQWFVNINQLKPRIKKIFSSSIETSPLWLGSKLEELILKREEWCLSRQRVWGTPIPVLFDEEDNPILDLKQVKHNIEILSKEGIETWYREEASYFLHSSLKEKYSKQKLKKSQDILDVWFDSGCSWGTLPNETIADVYLEGFDQLRGWFNSSSTISIALREKLPYKSIVGHGFVLDKDGNKMSKSKGNVVDPLELIEKYGADIVRLWIGLNNYLEDIKITPESIEASVSLYRKIRNTVFRYSLSVLPKGFKIDYRVLNNLSQPENIYIYQLFRDSWIQIEEHLKNYHFFKAIKTSLNFINIYSGWYIEICKDTLYCDHDSPEVLNIIGIVFEKFLFLYSIFLPQTAEEAWSFYRSNQSSIFLETLEDLPVKNYEVPKDKWERFWSLRDEIYVLIEELKNKGEVAGSIAVKVFLPKDKEIPELNLLKLLNVAEIVSSKELGVEKTKFEICQRCRRFKPDLSKESICTRCLEFTQS